MGTCPTYNANTELAICRENLHLATLVLVGGHEDGFHGLGVYITEIPYDTVASMYPGSSSIEILSEPRLSRKCVQTTYLTGDKLCRS